MDPTEMHQRRAASTALACLAVTCLLLLMLASVAPITLMLAPVALCWALLFGGLALLVAPRRST